MKYIVYLLFSSLVFQFVTSAPAALDLKAFEQNQVIEVTSSN